MGRYPLKVSVLIVHTDEMLDSLFAVNLGRFRTTARAPMPLI